MKTFFTADTHFNHTNIVKYCNRPFNSVDEMNETILTNWNNVVSNEDRVYVLGDFALRKDFDVTKLIFENLNNKEIYLIKGNHDNDLVLNLPWTDVYDTKEIQIGKQKLWLSHYAHRVWPDSFKGSIHLYGHSHGTLAPIKNSFDCGVDVFNFTPIDMEMVLKTK